MTMREWTKGMRVRGLDKARDVLFFTAGWCQPCKAIKASLERRLKAGRPGELESIGRILVVDVDAFPRVADAFGIRSMPTFLRLSDDARLVSPTVPELLAFLGPDATEGPRRCPEAIR